jgi:hypothetical protein
MPDGTGDIRIKIGYDDKYMCGLIRFTSKFGSSASTPIDYCKDFENGDRGWFRRVHDFCNEVDCKNHPREIDKLVGYGGVMSFAIVCGIGWILSGLIALAGSLKPDKLIAIIAGALFTVLYAVFIGVFTAVWVSVRRVRKECSYTSVCDAYMKRTRKSSNEFLAYSICAFVLIIGAIICCFFSSTLITGNEEEYKAVTVKKTINQSHEENVEVQKSGERMNDNQDIEKSKVDNMSHQQPNADSEIAPICGMPIEESKRYNGEEFKGKFELLHEYINDPVNMQKYADSKFDEVDTDKSGTITISELKDFVTRIMNSKGLPPPTDQQVDALMKYFDLDKSNTLEKYEFEKMLHEVFIESREILVRSYAEKKANSWKPMKVPADKDTSELSNLDNLLKEPKDFYKTVDDVANEKGYNRESVMNINEITELARGTSNKFGVPILSKSDIEEVMDDIKRPISEFNKVDQNLATFLALTISRKLID